jgi:hypothetical protein
MQIKVVDGKLSLTSLFAPVAVGYGVGAGLIFLPAFLLVGLVGSFAPVVDQSGQTISGAAIFLPMVIMVPFILLMQSVIFAGLIMLGLAVYRRFGKIEVTSVRETPE